MSTSQSIGETRADLLAEWIAKQPELIRTIEDVARMPEVRQWRPDILADALDRLVADGRLMEAADGVLFLLPAGGRS
jgi:hypothetical protein